MYRRPKFLEILIEIRQEMSREADYDADLFAEMIRSGKFKDNSRAESRKLKNEFPANEDRAASRER